MLGEPFVKARPGHQATFCVSWMVPRPNALADLSSVFWLYALRTKGDQTVSGRDPCGHINVAWVRGTDEERRRLVLRFVDAKHRAIVAVREQIDIFHGSRAARDEQHARLDRNTNHTADPIARRRLIDGDDLNVTRAFSSGARRVRAQPMLGVWSPIHPPESGGFFGRLDLGFRPRAAGK
jgi:hypothetical protein